MIEFSQAQDPTSWNVAERCWRYIDPPKNTEQCPNDATGGIRLKLFPGESDAEALREASMLALILDAKRRRPAGVKEGTPNKLTGTVKMMVLGALEKLGGRSTWLVKQAKKHPQAFMTLLGKIIPTQVVGDMSYRFVAACRRLRRTPRNG
jgi:hypothetical protein